MNRQRQEGFTLVEIMIVVAIIALLAAIAIPNLLRARHNANQTAAIAMLRTISTSEESYRAAQTPPTYGTCAQLTAAVPPYLNIACGVARQGYNFAWAGQDANTYCATGTPVTVGTTGTTVYAVDGSGVVRATGTCTAAAPWTAGGAAVE